MLRSMNDEYGIVANVAGVDRFARQGSKAWLVGGTGGEGWYRFKWLCRTRSGKLAVKWIPTKRMHNFRCAWITEHLRDAAEGHIYISGTRAEMERAAFEMNKFVADEFGCITSS